MNPTALLNAMPGAISQGLIWGIMAIGVYLTYKILDVADLTVDGTLCTGGATFIMATMAGCSIPVAFLLVLDRTEQSEPIKIQLKLLQTEMIISDKPISFMTQKNQAV